MLWSDVDLDIIFRKANFVSASAFSLSCIPTGAGAPHYFGFMFNCFSLSALWYIA